MTICRHLPFSLPIPFSNLSPLARVKWLQSICSGPVIAQHLAKYNKHLQHDRVTDKDRSSPVFCPGSTQNIKQIIITSSLLVSLTRCGVLHD